MRRAFDGERCIQSLEMAELVEMERFLDGESRDVVQLSHFHCDSPCAAKDSVNLGEGENPVGKRKLISKLKPNLQLTSCVLLR